VHLPSQAVGGEFTWAARTPRRYEVPERNAVVAVYGTHVEAEGAVKELERAGVDMRSLSIVGRDSHTEEQVVGYYNTGDRMM